MNILPTSRMYRLGVWSLFLVLGGTSCTKKPTMSTPQTTLTAPTRDAAPSPLPSQQPNPVAPAPSPTHVARCFTKTDRPSGPQGPSAEIPWLDKWLFKCPEAKTVVCHDYTAESHLIAGLSINWSEAINLINNRFHILPTTVGGDVAVKFQGKPLYLAIERVNNSGPLNRENSHFVLVREDSCVAYSLYLGGGENKFRDTWIEDLPLQEVPHRMKDINNVDQMSASLVILIGPPAMPQAPSATDPIVGLYIREEWPAK